MRGFYGHLLSRDALKKCDLSPYPQLDATAVAAIIVGPDGRRLLDEGYGGIYAANALAALDDPASATIVLDAAIWEGPGRDAQIPANPHLERAGGTIYRAQTIEELAAQAGLDPTGLSATVAQYNDALAAGSISELSPRRTTEKAKAWPILTPPFMAIPICAGITHTMGGIAINGDGQVLRPDGVAISGLYAVGPS